MKANKNKRTMTMSYHQYETAVANELAGSWGSKNAWILIADYKNIVHYQWLHTETPMVAANLIDWVVTHKPIKIDYKKPLDFALNAEEVRIGFLR